MHIHSRLAACCALTFSACTATHAAEAISERDVDGQFLARATLDADELRRSIYKPVSTIPFPVERGFKIMTQASVRMVSMVIAGITLPLAVLYAAERTVPLEVINNYPVVEVEIDGQNIPVAFDLGGDQAIELTTTALNKIRVQYLTESYIWLDARGNKLQARKFVIPELRIGDVVFRDVEGHEDAEAPNWPRVRAGLGRMGRALFFPSHKLEVDYKGKAMRLDPECTGHRVAFDPTWNGEPVAVATTDVGDITFFWDTGAPMNIVQAATAEKIGGGDGDRNSVTSATFLLNQKEFGPIELRPLKFIQPEGVDGFIGYDFFARHKVCIDFPGRAFWVE